MFSFITRNNTCTAFLYEWDQMTSSGTKETSSKKS